MRTRGYSLGVGVGAPSERASQAVGLFALWIAACGPATGIEVVGASDPAPRPDAVAEERCRLGEAGCERNYLRAATYNVQAVGAPGTGEYQALVSILRRLDPDVVCLQEVMEDDRLNVRWLAEDAGYAHVAQGNASNPMAAGFTNACLSRVPFVAYASRTSKDVAQDDAAQEIARDIVEVVVSVADRDIHIFNAHLKAGSRDEDRFRRRVETERIRQMVARNLEYESSAFIVLGDFNETVEDRETLMAELPDALPRSFRLGTDLTLPLPGAPIAVLTEELVRANPSWEDAPDQLATHIRSGRQIDHIFFRNLEVRGGEVYEACSDNGRDDGAPGGRLEKAGLPLDCGLTDQASDHRPVVVDLAW